jgi:dihydrofolate reductase
VSDLKASVYIATSLDGFIARENGDLDWLPGADGAAAGEDYGYAAFMASVDILVMGRKTFEKVLSFGAWPYGDKPVVVLSRGGLEIPEHLAPSVEVMAGSPQEVVARLAGRGAKHVYVDGGETIQGFLRAGLVSQIILARIPILIGSGVPLFGPLPHDIQLRHVETRQYPNGIVQSRYEVSE